MNKYTFIVGTSKYEHSCPFVTHCETDIEAVINFLNVYTKYSIILNGIENYKTMDDLINDINTELERVSLKIYRITKESTLYDSTI